MPNKHIKVINGRRYYYESIRKGKKVTSRYIGPVDERKRRARKAKAEEIQEATQQQQQAQEQQVVAPEQEYIG